MKDKSVQALQLIYWAIFAAMVLFTIVAVALAPRFAGVAALAPHQIETLKSVIILLALAGIPSGFVFHNRKVRRIPADMDWKGKMKLYRNSFIFKVALLESLALLSLIGFLLSVNMSFLYITLLLLVAYLLNVPTKEKIALELDPLGSMDEFKEEE
ncbi:hypothetical protein [Geofilum rubicundum]|uniref:Uncharacterized protein n=1 Tax=Geofilum rubicundum JCM 15548 TaxID=1236989 RepID=A0A0E9LRF2_9BACT|nr:hypothetical protein [Geofilum rubicundum]GAO28167.1 hypothetical protein JCM15548_231 [Geofilum rubicundum JCM 15548]